MSTAEYYDEEESTPRNYRSPARFVKYIVGGVAGLILFVATYFLQYPLWFPESLGDVAVAYVVNKGAEALDEHWEQQKANAVKVTDAGSLSAAVKEYKQKNDSFFGLLAYYEFPHSEEKVYIEALPADWESAKLSRPQITAFDAFVSDYPLGKDRLLESALERYNAMRDEHNKRMETSKTSPTRPFSKITVMPAISLEELQNGPVDVKVTITSWEKDRKVYVKYQFIPKGKGLAYIGITTLGDQIVKEEDMFEDEDGEEDDFWQDGF